MTTVTVLGAASQVIHLTYTESANANIARQIAGMITTGVLDGSIVPATDKKGSPPPVPSGKTGEFVQTKSGTLVLPAHYTALVETASNAVVFGNSESGQKILAGTTTDLTFFAGGGSGSIAAAGSHNRIVIPGSDKGDWLISTGAGTDIINVLGSGNATINAGGGHNAIVLGSGQSLLELSGDDTVTGGTGNATIDASSSSSSPVYGKSGAILFVGGVGGATIFGGAGSTTYFGGLGGPSGGGHHRGEHHDHDHGHHDHGHHHGHDDDHDDDHGHGGGGGSAGPQVVHGGTAGNNYLFAGVGAGTLWGGGAGDQFYTFGTAAQALIAGVGGATLFGAFGAGNDTFVGGSGNDEIITGTGKDLVIGGQGHDTVFATDPGHDTFEFVFGKAGGSELVQNIYDASDVHIKLEGYKGSEKSHALATQTTTGSSVTISLTDGTTITFENITHLTGKNFV